MSTDTERIAAALDPKVDVFNPPAKAAYTTLAAMPARELATRVVSSLIRAKGNLNEYAEVIEALIVNMREEEAQDAARWRALVGCARVWVQGHAGLTPGSPYAAFEHPYAHIGVALWTVHDPVPEETEPGRKTLTLFADKARGAIASSGEHK